MSDEQRSGGPEEQAAPVEEIDLREHAPVPADPEPAGGMHRLDALLVLSELAAVEWDRPEWLR